MGKLGEAKTEWEKEKEANERRRIYAEIDAAFRAAEQKRAHEQFKADTESYRQEVANQSERTKQAQAALADDQFKRYGAVRPRKSRRRRTRRA